MKFLPFLLLLATLPTLGQERYLVSPNEEVVRLNPGEDARQAIRKRARPSDTQVCASKFMFGYDYWQSYDFFGARDGDVLGEWFVAKGTGIIDTIIWTMGDVPTDSIVRLRIHRSFIGPEYGPGVRPGPWDPPCQQWGYWVNTNNPDGGITAFPEEATDTTWHSTIVGSPVPSTPPIGEPFWAAGGLPVVVQPHQEYFVPLDMFPGPIAVTAGDRFFISFEVGGGDSLFSRFLGTQYSVTTSDEDYPSRLWKYYAHGGEGTVCGTIPSDSLRSGWTARGAFSGDSTQVAVINILYTMTMTANVPPVILDYPLLSTTFDTAARAVSVTIEDCNPANPGGAGVAGAVLRYSVNGEPQPDIPLIDAGADVFTGTVPGQPVGSSVAWRAVAWDFDGDTGSTPTGSYSVVPFGTEWYRIDTGYTCTERDLSSSGTEIDTSAFFVPAFAGSGTEPKDNGTAGPVDMGSSFILFGRPFRYAWIGVNGGMALSASPTDTQDVNANGRWLPKNSTSPWTIPGPSKEGRGTPLTAANIPEMYIAPLGADHIIGDSAGQYGRILTGNAGDTCLFIAQWDSIGPVMTYGSFPDITTFRAILNRCDGSVEFQYWSVGSAGLETAGLIGMQISPELAGTPGPGYVTVNRLGYPIETRPFDGYCVRFFPAAGMVVDAGWSLVSLSAVPKNGDFRTPVILPGLESRLYSYPYGAASPETLKPGSGYWTKSSTTSKIGNAPGELFHEVIVPVHDGWNLVGGTSDVVPTASIVPGGTTVSSSFFAYGSGGYASTSLLEPGDGYWVKVAGEGILAMNSWGSAPLARPARAGAPEVSGINPITFTDSKGRSQTLYLSVAGSLPNDHGRFDLPPPPPGGSFDVRFTSGKWVEPFPGDGGAAAGNPVSIRGAAFPVTVRWDLRWIAQTGTALYLTLPGAGPVIPMEGIGSAMLTDPATATVMIRSAEASPTALRYRLGPNYPNPFNPSTVIGFSIAKAGPVSLKVFNTLGEEVGTLVDGELPAGDHSAEWRPAGLPSGIYFCRLTAGEYSDTRKLVLMK